MELINEYLNQSEDCAEILYAYSDSHSDYEAHSDYGDN